MTTEPIRPDLQEYLQQRHDNALLPVAYREPLAPVRQGAFSMPPELLAGLLVDREAAHQRELALVTQNAHLQATMHANTQMSGRAKGIALVSAAGGVGVGAATTGIGFAAGMVGANAHGLLVAAIAFAIGTGCVALLKLLFGGTSMLRSGGNHYETHQHIHAKGMFAKAIGGSTTNG